MPRESTSRANVNSPARGCLYLVATPIGNLEDITLRALRILREADQIACEDTRHTRKLLEHYDIHKPLVSYHEHNEMTRAAELLISLEQGAKIALVTDAGMPVVSDPGFQLVSLCRRHQIRVVPVPGPSALLGALSASGIASDEFVFVGFLPSRQGERRRALDRLRARKRHPDLPLDPPSEDDDSVGWAEPAAPGPELADLRLEDRTTILYEAPHRLEDCLADALEILGDRPGCLAREITKLHEEFQHGRLSQLLELARENPPRGEITLVLGPPENRAAGTLREATVSLAQRVDELIRQAKLDRKDALKLVARERGLTRRAAYQEMLKAREQERNP